MPGARLPLPIDTKLVERLYAAAEGDRWHVSMRRFAIHHQGLDVGLVRSGDQRKGTGRRQIVMPA